MLQTCSFGVLLQLRGGKSHDKSQNNFQVRNIQVRRNSR